MKIERIFISNFKSIPQDGVTLKFRDGMIALVGKNNAGKSNILEAIGILFGSKNPVYFPFPKDCFNDPAQPIIIEAEISSWTGGLVKVLGYQINSVRICAMKVSVLKPELVQSP